MTPVHRQTASPLATVVSGGGRRKFPSTGHVAIAGMGQGYLAAFTE